MATSLGQEVTAWFQATAVVRGWWISWTSSGWITWTNQQPPGWIYWTPTARLCTEPLTKSSTTYERRPSRWLASCTRRSCVGFTRQTPRADLPDENKCSACCTTVLLGWGTGRVGL